MGLLTKSKNSSCSRYLAAKLAAHIAEGNNQCQRVNQDRTNGPKNVNAKIEVTFTTRILRPHTIQRRCIFQNQLNKLNGQVVNRAYKNKLGDEVGASEYCRLNDLIKTVCYTDVIALYLRM